MVSGSTAEAEYKSLAAVTSDIIWLLSLLQELNVKSNDIPNIWCDSSSEVAVAANPVLHSKFKHVELDHFFSVKRLLMDRFGLLKFLGLIKWLMCLLSHFRFLISLGFEIFFGSYPWGGWMNVKDIMSRLGR